MIEMVKGGETDVVLAFAVSRLGRNLAQVTSFAEMCRDNGVVLVSATEQIDTAGMWGPIILAVLAAGAEIESAMKSERGHVARATSTSAGTWPGGVVPFGYEVNGDNRLVAVPSEADEVARAIRDVIAGTSVSAIVRRWNAGGLRTREGHLWGVSTLGRVLQAEYHVSGGVVTESDRRRLVEIFDSRRTGRAGGRFLLRGLICCAEHDRPMVGAGNKYQARCEVPGDHRARTHMSIRSGPVDVIVTELVEARRQSNPWEPVVLDDPTNALVAEREAYVEQLRELGRDLTIDPAFAQGRTEALRERIEELTTKIDKAKPQPRTFVDVNPDAAASVFERLRRYVAKVEVSPLAAPTGWVFDTGRLRVVWTDGTVASADEVAQAWERARAAIEADAAAAEQDAEGRR